MTRPTYNRVCQCCGKDFTARHSVARWCNVNCRVQAYYCRKRGEPVRPAYSTFAAPAPSLPTRTTPLIGPRPTDAELASQLHQEASETLDSIQFELELLNEPSTSPLVKAIAQELNATAHRLTKLAAALTAVA